MFAAPFHLGDLPPRAGGADAYARTEHPTLRVFESAVGALDGGRCLSFATGMAAISAAVLACVGSGDRRGAAVGRLLHDPAAGPDELERFGIRVDQVATPEVEAYAAGGGLDGARLVLLETPSNPLLDVCDIAAVARAAHAAGALVAVDNTTATPLGQRPLDLGADLTVGSDTKALTGHSDLLLGHVSTRDDALYAAIQRWRNNTGNTPGPFEAWLGHRSMSTLDLRLARQAQNAAAVAELLAASPAVTGVRWPWREGDPSFALASRQMLRPNGVVSAELADEAAVTTLLAAAGSGPPPRASAACTAPSTGGRSGAATPFRPGSCGCRAASRTPPTWSPTCQSPWLRSTEPGGAPRAGAAGRQPQAQRRCSRRGRPSDAATTRRGSGRGSCTTRTA